MKPEWKDAPLWANYLVMNYNGEWWWCAEKPILCGDFYKSKYRMEKVIIKEEIWKNSLEKRPEVLNETTKK